jgi:acyl dehydratase
VRYFDDLETGLVMHGDEVIADLNEMLDFARKNDPFPMHTDEEAAKKTPFGGIIASGGYTVTLWFRSGVPVLQSVAMVAGLEWRIRLTNPVRPGDVLRNRCEVVGREASSRPGRGKVFTRQLMLNQADEPVMEIDAAWLVETRP